MKAHPAYLPEASLIRALYRIAKRRFGEVPEPFTVTTHHRRLLIANNDAPSLLRGVAEAP